MASEESEQSESSGKESAAGKGFQMKLGPLKVWQWGLIVIGGVVGIVIVRKLVGGGSGVASAVGTGAGTTGIGATSSAPAASTQDFASAIQNLSDSVTKQFAAQAAATQAVATQEQADVQALGAAQTTQGSALSTALNNAIGTLQSAIGQNANAITSVGQIASQAKTTAANAQATAANAQATANVGANLAQSISGSYGDLSAARSTNNATGISISTQDVLKRAADAAQAGTTYIGGGS